MAYKNKFKITIHVMQFTNYSFYMIMFDDYGSNGAHVNSLHMIFSKKFHVIRRSWNRVNRGPLSRRVNPSPCFKAVKTTIDLNFASLWRLHRVNKSCAKSALEFEIVKCKIPWFYQTLNQLSLADIGTFVMQVNHILFKIKSIYHIIFISMDATKLSFQEFA